MKQPRLPFVCLTVLGAWLVPGALLAQTDLDIPPSRGGRTYSLGMPPVYKGHAGVEGGSYRPGSEGELLLSATFGVHRDLGSPIVGLGAIDSKAISAMPASTSTAVAAPAERIPYAPWPIG